MTSSVAPVSDMIHRIVKIPVAVAALVDSSQPAAYPAACSYPAGTSNALQPTPMSDLYLQAAAAEAPLPPAVCHALLIALGVPLFLPLPGVSGQGGEDVRRGRPQDGDWSPQGRGPAPQPLAGCLAGVQTRP
jgi:hypothetical protein